MKKFRSLQILQKLQILQSVVRDYLENIFFTKGKSLDEMDTFFKSYCLPYLKQDDLEFLNRLIVEKIEILIKRLLKNKRPCPDGFTKEFIQTFRRYIANPFQVLSGY